MRKAVLLAVLALGLLVWLAAQDRVDLSNYFQDRTESLVKQITEKKARPSERGAALSSLEGHNFEKAVEVAETLLGEEDQVLRMRAAWILALDGQDIGLHVLRAIAPERSEESVIAIEALGRLRDPKSHDLLRSLLEREMAMSKKPGLTPWASASFHSLADYGDANDAALLARAAAHWFNPFDWVMADALGRTAGRDAIPILEELFTKGKGWTVMTAGLGLARCGSERGVKYVRERLADTSGDPSKPNESYPTDGRTDDPYGPKATDFILSRMGVPADEVFVADLLGIVTSSEYDYREKGGAWGALRRMNPEKHREELLRLAWTNVQNRDAIKLIVLNDESRARAVAGDFEKSEDPARRAQALALKIALSESPRERRRWREVHGYTF